MSNAVNLILTWTLAILAGVLTVMLVFVVGISALHALALGEHWRALCVVGLPLLGVSAARAGLALARQRWC